MSAVRVTAAVAAAAWLVGFISMVYDKWAAKHRPRHRVPEAALLTLAVCGGAPAMCVAMWLCRHKTRHRKFSWGLPVLAVCQLGAAVFWLIKETVG